MKSSNSVNSRILFLDAIDADLNESETIMTREQIAEGLTTVFSFGEEEYEYAHTVKIRTVASFVEAYFVLLYSLVFCEYGGLNSFIKTMDEIGSENLPPVPLFPVGAVCPVCSKTIDISEEFYSHTRGMAMAYCIDNDLEYSSCNRAVVEMNQIVKAFRAGELADSFHYKCQICESQYKYETVISEMKDMLPELPFGYLDTCSTRILENTEDPLKDISYEDFISFVLFAPQNEEAIH